MTDIYPNAPGFKAHGTSEDAAAEILPKAKIILHLVLEALRNHGQGMTADECAEKLNMSVLSIRPRFSELKEFGWIVDTNERRRNASGKKAIVWTMKE
jgi:transcription initiation factor IIE alpha subunit